MNNLESFATKIVAKNHFVKASFGGFAGSGKSRTATEFIRGAYKDLGLTKPVLIIDNEKGSRFLIPFFKKSNIQAYVKDTVKLPDVLKAMELLNSGEIDFLFIDSLSKVWYDYVKGYKKKNNKTFMTLQDWGKILPEWQAQFSDLFVDLEGSCVFTGRGGFTYDQETDENNKKTFVKSGVKMKLAGETPFEPDLNIWMSMEEELNGDLKVWREAQIMKDRSGLIDGMTFKNPTYGDFKPVVDYLKDVETGEVAGASDTTDLAPKEHYNDGKTRRDILIEKVEAEYAKTGLSKQKADHKPILIMITEKVFGTASFTEVKQMTTDELTDGVFTLQTFNEKFAAYVKNAQEQGLDIDKSEIEGLLDDSLEELSPEVAQ